MQLQFQNTIILILCGEFIRSAFHCKGAGICTKCCACTCGSAGMRMQKTGVEHTLQVWWQWN